MVTTDENGNKIWRPDPIDFDWILLTESEFKTKHPDQKFYSKPPKFNQLAWIQPDLQTLYDRLLENPTRFCEMIPQEFWNLQATP